MCILAWGIYWKNSIMGLENIIICLRLLHFTIQLYRLFADWIWLRKCFEELLVVCISVIELQWLGPDTSCLTWVSVWREVPKGWYDCASYSNKWKDPRKTTNSRRIWGGWSFRSSGSRRAFWKVFEWQHSKEKDLCPRENFEYHCSAKQIAVWNEHIFDLENHSLNKDGG